ncbi:MAG: N-acetyltransferase [Nitrospirota bacterium]
MIRKALLPDVKAIQALINSCADTGQMLPRTLHQLYEHIRDFSVCMEKDTLIGVCALQVSWEGLAEVRSLAVRHDYRKKGIGSALVRQCLIEAKELQIDRVFALTYQDAFFRKLGFQDIDKKELPHKIWTDCFNCIKFPNCDESALIITIPSS